MRFYLVDVEQTKKYALYDKFWIDDESKKYTLHISDYSGDAGNIEIYYFIIILLLYAFHISLNIIKLIFSNAYCTNEICLNQ